jgi:hypothetical protein
VTATRLPTAPDRTACWPQRLGSINAAAAELGTTWPSLRKAFTRHGLGMPTRKPEAARHRAIARHRSGQLTLPTTPPLDRMFVALNRGQLPPQRGPKPELVACQS